MIASLKAHFTPRFILLVLGASLLFTGLDVMINRSHGSLVESDLLPTLPVSTKRLHKESSRASLPTDYASFDEEKAVEVAVDNSALPSEIGMSDAEQSLQQGLVPKLYIGDKMYRLDALVKRLQASALLKVTSTAGTEVKDDIVALQLGDILGPYTVTDINSRRLELSAGERKIWLALFTPQSGKPEAEISPLTSNVKQ